jgi:hypothetical protein
MVGCFRVLILFLLMVKVSMEPLLEFLNIQENHREIDFDLSEKCEKSLIKISEGIKQNEIWAIKISDASGKSHSGFVWGNKFWLGSETACEVLNHPKKFPLTSSNTRLMLPHVINIATEVPVEYRMFYASHTSPIQFDPDLFEFDGLHVGLCFPKACQEQEINRMAQVVFQSGEFTNIAMYGNVTFTKTKNLKVRANFFDEIFVRISM